jgi:hypothetical protein
MANEGVFGQQHLASDDGDGFNSLSFLVKMMIGRLSTATLVQVKAVHSAGRLAPVNFVDVSPLVNLLAGDGSAIPHATIHEVPYLRLQGGSNAIILDPHVGDIGICVFADRDISGVKSANAQANPGSKRRFDMADAMYFGGWNRVAPINLVLIDDAGIKVDAPSCPVEVTGNTITLNGPVTINGTLHTTGAVTLDSTLNASGDGTFAGTSVHTHVHSGVTSGGSNTGAPV